MIRNLIFLVFVIILAAIFIYSLEFNSAINENRTEILPQKNIKVEAKSDELSFILDQRKVIVLRDLELYLSKANAKWRGEDKEDIANTLLDIEKKYGFNHTLFLRIMKVESNFDIRAISKDGAVGLCQIQPKTAEFISLKSKSVLPPKSLLFDPVINLRLSALYLDYLENKYKSLPKALSAYNFGPTRYSQLSMENGLSKTSYHFKLEKD
jgi:soluble lytic murein transglycosylase-like protein